MLKYFIHYSNVGRQAYETAIQNAIQDEYITMLIDFNKMGALMRHVMTSALTNPQKYKNLIGPTASTDTEYDRYCQDSNEIYQNAVRSLPNPKPLHEYKGKFFSILHFNIVMTKYIHLSCIFYCTILECASLQEHLQHTTFLEELMFWTVAYQFPQKLVCLLLNILPDPEFKEALTRAFVLHYSRVSMMLERSTDPDVLSNKVVHVSVQVSLFICKEQYSVYNKQMFYILVIYFSAI